MKTLTKTTKLILLALFFFASNITAQSILSGDDLLITPGTGGSFFNFTPPVVIPANFFGPGSDPFTGNIVFGGQPLSTTPASVFGPADCIVRRLAPGDPGTCGGQVTIPIEIVALNLVSVQPITVTYNGGQNPEPWNIRLNLSTSIQQPQGSMTVTKTHNNGGTFTSTLPVMPRFTFTRVTPPAAPIILDPFPFGPIQFLATSGNWVYSCPSCVAHGPALVDHDGDGTITVPVLASSNFYPAVASTGNCATPGNSYYFPNLNFVPQPPFVADHQVVSPYVVLPVPTLPQWGLIILGLLFVAFSIVYIRK